jgi:hypothetical protein
VHLPAPTPQSFARIRFPSGPWRGGREGPNPISSLVLASSALGPVAACAIAAKGLMTSGVPPRKFLSSAVSCFVISGQSLIALSPR